MGQWKDVLDLYYAQKAAIDDKIREGIEANRKGNCSITVVDGQGKPIPGAKVEINQTSHAFRFGANLFMLEEMETPEKNEAYKASFADVFNMATLPFYWDANEPEKGKNRYEKDSTKFYRRPPIDLCMDFCREHGIEPREHGLAYNAFFPAWLYQASEEEEKTAIERRCREIAERYADKIPTIEVTNEMCYKQGKTSFYDAPEFVEWCFRTARKYFPDNQLVINEWTTLSWEDKCRVTDKYYAYTEANILRGAPIDAVGMQYHLFFDREKVYEDTRLLLDPVMLYRHMDLYARLGKPLQITEVTVPSYSWEQEDEQLQAEILEMLYRIWFSHPNVEQIIYWNLVDGYAHVWKQDPAVIRESQGNMTVGENYYHGGLLRFDLTPKPAYHKLKHLLKKVWHTELELTSDKEGSADFRGFYGSYEITVTANGETRTHRIDLSKTTDNQFVLAM